MKALVRSIGAIPIELGFREHDLITAVISHIPHIAAAALVNLACKSEAGEVMKMLAAGGFKDMTRIASSDPEMWESIIMSNKEQVLKALSGYENILSDLRSAVDSGNTAQIVEFFRSAGKYRSEIKDGGKGLIEPIFELDVDIVDKPGAIGEVSMLLGNNLVNIKNMNVVNSRENVQGCLRISLSDSENLKKAFKLLKDSGYGVFSSSSDL
jgi:prephenate dehydrogenase